MTGFDQLNQLSSEELRTLAAHATFFRQHGEPFADEFNHYLTEIPELVAIVRSHSTLERFRMAQKWFFETLGDAESNDDHHLAMVRAGQTHHRIGLEPRWMLQFMNIYVRYIEEHGKDLGEEFLAAARKRLRIRETQILQAYDDALRRYDDISEEEMQYSTGFASLPWPEEMLVNFIDRDGVIRYIKPSARFSFPIHEGMTVQEKLVQRTVVYEVWKNRGFALQAANEERFGFPYFVASFSLFDEARSFMGTLSLVMPSDVTHRMNVLREERDVLNWLVRVARDVFGVVKADTLWGQFRDMFLQLFKVREGLIMVDNRGEIELFEHFGQGQLTGEELAWFQHDARTQRDAAVLGKHVTLMGKTWELDRYEVQMPSRREILYVLRAHGEKAHPMMGVVIDYYHLVREIVEQRILLQEANFLDPLTMVWNRRALEHHMEVYFSRRDPAPAVFLLFDLDGFKQLNDEFGHPTGDEALRAIAHYARHTLREGDWVVRLGGDEFVLVLHETTWNELIGAKESIWKWIVDSPLRDYGLGLTAGIVEIPREAQTYQDAYRLADQRLYRGKQHGKGCVVTDDQRDPIRIQFDSTKTESP